MNSPPIPARSRTSKAIPWAIAWGAGGSAHRLAQLLAGSRDRVLIPAAETHLGYSVHKNPLPASVWGEKLTRLRFRLPITEKARPAGTSILTAEVLS